MIQSLLILVSTLGAPGDAPIAVAMKLDGSKAQGQLVAFSGEGVTIKESGKETTVPREQLLAVRFQPTNSSPELKRPIELELIDGSRLRGGSVNMESLREVALEYGESSIKLPSSRVAAIRFLGQQDGDDRQWREMRAMDSEGDLLIIRRGDTLDYVEGRTVSIGEAISFELDGDPIDVRRERVAGIVFLRPQNPDLADPVGLVRDRAGSTIQASSIRWVDDHFELATSAGAKLNLPSSQVREIDLAFGKIRFLSDLEPLAARYQPFLSLPESAPALTGFFALRRDQARDGGELLLDGKAYSKGLALRSGSEVRYRLPLGYSRVKGIVGIDDRVGSAGNVALTIQGDGRDLFSETLAGDQPARELDIEIAGVKELVITVDYGADADLGDEVDLADIRITK